MYSELPGSYRSVHACVMPLRESPYSQKLYSTVVYHEVPEHTIMYSNV